MAATARIPPHASRQPPSGAAERQQTGFGQQLGHDAQPAASERRAKRHLPLTRRRPREQHVGDVAARDEQQQDHGAEQREQHVAEPADDAVPQVEHVHAHLRRVLVGMQPGAPLRDRGHPFRRLRERDAGREVRLVPEAAFVGRRRAPSQREWHPHVGRLPRESRRHHADDGARRVADRHDLPRTSSRPPNFSTHAPWVEHDDRRRARPGIVFGEHAPLERRHAEVRKRVRRHLGDRDDVGAGGRAHDRGVGGADDDRLEHRLLLQQVERLVLSHRAAVVAVARLGVGHEHVDHPIGLHVRERVEEDVAQRAVDHRHAADAERQRQHGGDGEAGAASQHTRGVPDVLPEPLEQRDGVHGVDLFANPPGVPELAPGCGARLVGRHAARDVVVGLEVEVRLELTGPLVVPPGPPEEAPPAHRYSVDRLQDAVDGGDEFLPAAGARGELLLPVGVRR